MPGSSDRGPISSSFLLFFALRQPKKMTYLGEGCNGVASAKRSGLPTSSKRLRYAKCINMKLLSCHSSLYQTFAGFRPPAYCLNFCFLTASAPFKSRQRLLRIILSHCILWSFLSPLQWDRASFSDRQALIKQEEERRIAPNRPFQSYRLRSLPPVLSPAADDLPWESHQQWLQISLNKGWQ